VGGGGISGTAGRPAISIFLKIHNFNEARFARLAIFAAAPTLRTEYKPAARRWISLA